MPCAGIACGDTTGYLRNFAQAPLVDTDYPVALANALVGSDLEPESHDLDLWFSGAESWSFVTSGTPGPGTDFVAVALHELAHGLGFTGHMYESYNVGFCGSGPPCPTAYDRFAVDSLGVPLLNYLPSNPYTLAARLKSAARFGGANTVARHAAPAPLYTPQPHSLLLDIFRLKNYNLDIPKTMFRELTTPAQDYLKAIYHLQEQQAGPVSTSQIAERMQVTPASVTSMVRKLAESDPPLLEYTRHHGVRLTSAGQRVALELIRHHRLIETFLYQFLGFPWDEVHAEAERLEHVISEELEARLAQALGHPQRDPHGEPIPGPDLHLAGQAVLLLAELRPGQQAVVVAALDTAPAFLRFLWQIGLVPQAHLEVVGYSPLDENLTLRLAAGPTPLVLGPRITRQVSVELV